MFVGVLGILYRGFNGGLVGRGFGFGVIRIGSHEENISYGVGFTLCGRAVLNFALLV